MLWPCSISGSSSEISDPLVMGRVFLCGTAETAPHCGFGGNAGIPIGPADVLCTVSTPPTEDDTLNYINTKGCLLMLFPNTGHSYESHKAKISNSHHYQDYSGTGTIVPTCNNVVTKEWQPRKGVEFRRSFEQNKPA